VVTKKVVSQGRLFLRHVIPAFFRPVHTLWHEIIGFLFIVIAAFFGLNLVTSIRKFNGEPAQIMRIAGAAFFVILLGGYGVSSFLRARKISRS
jgi:hypothetical protein